MGSTIVDFKTDHFRGEYINRNPGHKKYGKEAEEAQVVWILTIVSMFVGTVFIIAIGVLYCGSLAKCGK